MQNIHTYHPVAQHQRTLNPSFQVFDTPRRPTSVFRNGVLPNLPTNNYHWSLQRNVQGAAAPLPPRSRQPTGLPACLPAPPDQRWSHNNWFPARRTWLSYRATPRFHRGHSKVAGNLPLLRCLLPRAGQLAADLFLSAVACCTDLLTSVGGKGWRTK